MNNPSVLIITPSTPDRAYMHDRLISIIRRQSRHYDGQITSAWDWSNRPIFEKLNSMIRDNVSDIVIRMDSDDLYSDDWVARSVSALVSLSADITGLDNAYFYNTITGQTREYICKPHQQSFILGATMCFCRYAWERRPFAPVRDNIGEDAHFQANNGIVLPHGYKQGFIATVHGSNTESHKAFLMMKQTTVIPSLLHLR